MRSPLSCQATGADKTRKWHAIVQSVAGLREGVHRSLVLLMLICE
jgi:hypothetical protein